MCRIFWEEIVMLVNRECSDEYALCVYRRIRYFTFSFDISQRDIFSPCKYHFEDAVFLFRFS